MSSRSPSADAAASPSASASSASARTATPTKSENGEASLRGEEEPTTRGHAAEAKHHHVDPHGAGHDDGETTPDGRGAAAMASSESRDNLNDTISKTFGYMPPSSAEPVIAAEHSNTDASPADSATPMAASPNAAAPPGANEGRDTLEDFVATMRTAGEGPASHSRLTDIAAAEQQQQQQQRDDAGKEDGAPAAQSGSASFSRSRNRKSFKLQEAPLGPRASAIDHLMLTASPTRAIVCPPMQIRPSAVADAAAKLQYRPANVPAVLPSPLPAPLAQRCDFCIKFDSVCSQCHFKWVKGEQKARHAALVAFLRQQVDSSRVLAFFASIASGSTEFVKAMLNEFPDAIHWNAHFCGGAVRAPATGARQAANLGGDDASASPPVEPSTVGSSNDVAAAAAAEEEQEGAAGPGKRAVARQSRALHPGIDSAGRVFALHVAMAADRVEVARLLIERGAPFRRSDGNVLPLDLLPSPPPERWTEALGSLSAYRVHVLCERSKALRKEGSFDEAAALYLEALGEQHSSEHALCGLAKMAFDGADYAEAVRRCDEILARQSEVAWGQFAPETVKLLRQHSKEKLHEVSHARHGPALRECGCVILDFVRLSLRRLPFKVVRLHIVPFIDCIDAAAVNFALRKMPLVTRTLAGHAAALHPEFVFRWIMSEKDNAERVVAELRRNVPEPDHVHTEGPVAFRGFRVFAVADFNAIIVTSYAEMINAAATKKKESVWSFGKKKEQLPKTLWFAKQYQLSRVKADEPWTINAAGEWEGVSPPATTKAPANSAATSAATSAAPSAQASPGK